MSADNRSFCILLRPFSALTLEYDVGEANVERIVNQGRYNDLPTFILQADAGSKMLADRRENEWSSYAETESRWYYLMQCSRKRIHWF